MPIFRLEGDDISNAELVIAHETDLELENHLESWMANSPRALTQRPILWIGRQTSARDEEGTIYPDLLGIDTEGNVIVVELKRNETSREVIAQLLEYATWANKLTDRQIQQIAEDYFSKYKEKSFYDAYKDMFDIPESEDIPPLNLHLRMFIVAEDISERVAGVCRFLRDTHSMDINCISVSTFQTKSGERIVSLEKKVGDEDIDEVIIQRQSSSDNKQWTENKPTKEVVWEIVQDLTKEDTKNVFTLKEVRESIIEKYPDFNMNTLRYVMIKDRANDPAPNQNSISNPDGRYWWISKGKYSLFDPDKTQRADSDDPIQD